MTGFAYALLLSACRGPLEALPFEYAGCVDTAGGCEVGASPLRLWAQSPTLTVELDGRAVDVVLEPVGGGTRATWTSPAPGELVVRDGDRASALQLLPAAERPWKPELDAARAEGPSECRRVADERLATASDADRAALLWALAGCELAAGDGAAVGHMRDAAEAFDRAGRSFDAARARCATSSVLFGTAGASLADVRGLLEAVPDTSPNAELAWGAAWHRALLHRRTGSYRAALDEAQRAELVATRVGLERERMTALELRATVYAELGRYAEAIRAQRELVDASPVAEGQCERAAEAARRTTLAWFLIQDARSASAPPAAEAIPLLEEAGRFHRACGLPAREIANVEVNLALAAWLGGDAAAAREHVGAARAAQRHPDALYAPELVALEARLSQAAGDLGSAERAWEQVVAMARLRGAPEAEAQALAGRADLRRAMGRREAAVDDLAAAHAALLGATSQVPLETGGAAFLSARSAVTERYVSLLLELGRDAGAMEVVRRARSHLVRSGHVRARLEALDPESQRRWDDAIGQYRSLRATMDAAAADGWSLPVDEVQSRRGAAADQEEAAARALDEALAILGEGGPAPAPAAPGPGDVLLAWYPAGDEWIGFAATADGVDVARIGSLPDGDDALGRALFGPFSDRLRSASRAVLLPWGELRAVEIQALPFDGEPLLARLPVVWSLDLGPGAPSSDGGRLVVSDPTGDLPGARAEGDAVSEAWPGARVLSGEAATVSALRAELGGARSWHYAGHASYREGDVWQSGLPLADGVLRVGDVLALPRVPREIVLSACESSRSEAASVETWGIAQAFVARGAVAVLATSRPVADGTGPMLVRSLYADGPGALDARARAAVLALRDAKNPDWTALRVWTP